jgi:hypothetical protein
MGNPRDYEKDGIPDLIGYPTPAPPKAVSARQVLRYVDRLCNVHLTHEDAIYADLIARMREADTRLAAPDPSKGVTTLRQIKALIEELETLL